MVEGSGVLVEGGLLVFEEALVELGGLLAELLLGVGAGLGGLLVGLLAAGVELRLEVGESLGVLLGGRRGGVALGGGALALGEFALALVEVLGAAVVVLLLRLDLGDEGLEALLGGGHLLLVLAPLLVRLLLMLADEVGGGLDLLLGLRLGVADDGSGLVRGLLDDGVGLGLGAFGDGLGLLEDLGLGGLATLALLVGETRLKFGLGLVGAFLEGGLEGLLAVADGLFAGLEGGGGLLALPLEIGVGLLESLVEVALLGLQPLLPLLFGLLAECLQLLGEERLPLRLGLLEDGLPLLLGLEARQLAYHVGLLLGLRHIGIVCELRRDHGLGRDHGRRLGGWGRLRGGGARLRLEDADGLGDAHGARRGGGGRGSASQGHRHLALGAFHGGNGLFRLERGAALGAGVGHGHGWLLGLGWEER